MPWSRYCVSLNCADHLPFLSELHICTSLCCPVVWGAGKLQATFSRLLSFLLPVRFVNERQKEGAATPLGLTVRAARGHWWWWRLQPQKRFLGGRQCSGMCSGRSAPSVAPRDSVLWAALLTPVLLHLRRGSVVIPVVTNLGVTFPSVLTALSTSCKKILYSTPCV